MEPPKFTEVAENLKLSLSQANIDREQLKNWSSESLYHEKRKKNYEKCGCMISEGKMVVYVTPNCPNGHLIRGQLTAMIKNCRRCGHKNIYREKQKER